MREFVKVTAVLVFCVSATAAEIVWFDDRPSQATWIWRMVFSAATVLAIALFLRIHFWQIRDLVPDFLGQQCKEFFEQNGLCFTVFGSREDDVCMINAMFQNRYDCPCLARIALRPVVGIFRSAVKAFRHREFSTIGFEISCGPGSFGIASIPLPVSRDHQGEKLTMQIGASVDYPQGKGRILRFRDGGPVRYDVEFRSRFYGTLKLLYLLCGGFLFTSPATVAFKLPAGVAESIPAELCQRTRILWTLGDDSSIACDKESARETT